MKTKRILALIISAVMVLSLLPSTVLAETEPEHQEWEKLDNGVYVAGTEVPGTGYYNISVGDSELTTGVTTLTKTEESDYDIYVDMENHIVKLNNADIDVSVTEQLQMYDKLCVPCHESGGNRANRTRRVAGVWEYADQEKITVIKEGTYGHAESGNNCVNTTDSCYYWPRTHYNFTFGTIGLALMDGEDWTLTLEGKSKIDADTLLMTPLRGSLAHATQVHGIYSRGGLTINGDGEVTINAANNCRAAETDGYMGYLSASGIYSGADMTIESGTINATVTAADIEISGMSVDYPNQYGAICANGNLTITSSEDSKTVVNAKSEIGAEMGYGASSTAIKQGNLADAYQGIMTALEITGDNTTVNAECTGYAAGTAIYGIEINIEGGEVSASSRCDDRTMAENNEYGGTSMGIYGEASTVITGGTVETSGDTAALAGMTLTVSGGDVTAECTSNSGKSVAGETVALSTGTYNTALPAEYLAENCGFVDGEVKEITDDIVYTAFVGAYGDKINGFTGEDGGDRAVAAVSAKNGEVWLLTDTYAGKSGLILGDKITVYTAYGTYFYGALTGDGVVAKTTDGGEVTRDGVTYTVTVYEMIPNPASAVAKIVKEDGSESFYTAIIGDYSVEDALEDGDTVVLLSDVELMGSFSPYANFTLDLNGFEMSCAYASTISMNNKEITVIDSNGGGKVTSTYQNGYALSGKGTIKGGEFAGAKAAIDGRGLVIESGVIDGVISGEVRIFGGTFKNYNVAKSLTKVLTKVPMSGAVTCTEGEASWKVELNDDPAVTIIGEEWPALTLTISGDGKMQEKYDVYYPWNGFAGEGDYTYLVQDCANQITRVVIEDDVKMIPKYAFADLRNLKSIQMGDNVESIGAWAFQKLNIKEDFYIPATVKEIVPEYNSYFKKNYIRSWASTPVTKFIVDTNNEVYCADEEGVLYSKDMTKLLAWPTGAEAFKDYIIPDTVKEEWQNDWIYEADLNSVTFPDNDEYLKEDISIQQSTHPDYTFRGWFADSEFETELGHPSNSNYNYAVTSAYKGKTIYAKWISKATFDVNGGVGESATKEILRGEALGELPDATHNTLSFKGWNTKPDGSGESVTADTIPQGHTTYYAVWGEKTTIGEGDAAKTVTVTAIPSYTYTGEAINPTVYYQVDGGETVAYEGEIVWSDNVNAGTATGAIIVEGAEVPVSFVINKAVFDTSTITFENNKSVTYDGKAHTHEIEGELPEEISVSYSYTKSNAPVEEMKDYGSYKITANFETGDNYEQIEPIAVNFRIAWAYLTIKADDKTMFVGGELPDFTYTVEGLAEGDNLENEGIEVALSTTADGKNGGVYEIAISGTTGKSATNNYYIMGASAYTPGKLTVTKHPAPAAPAAPVVESKTDTSITVAAVDGCEYSVDGQNWFGSNEIRNLEPGTRYTIYIRVKETLDTYGSVPSVTNAMTKSRPEAPAVTGSYAVSEESAELFVYTVDAIPGAVYSCDGETWQESNVFDSIAPDAKMNFFAKLLATDETVESAAGSTAVIFAKLNNTAVPALNYSIDGTTVTIAETEGAEYKLGEGEWSDVNTISDVTDTVDLAIRYKATTTLNASEAATATVDVTKEAQAAPEIGEVSFTLNQDEETYTAEIPEIDGAIYSFDGVTYSDERTKTDCLSGEEITVYVKLSATETKNESPAASASFTAPQSTVKPVVIVPASATFNTRQSVEITCETNGAVIYYTTDGSDPATSASRKVYTAPFAVTQTTTVRAVATKAGMASSEQVSAELISEEEVVTVTFESNGGSAVEAVTALRGEKISEPEAPVMSGYTFTGWYTDSECTAAYDFENQLVGSLTLYAGWKKNVSGTTGNTGGLVAGGDKSTAGADDLGNKENEKEDSAGTGDGSSQRFVDLDNHAWAADAINALAEAGVIKGTSETTFSPASNITRADFALLLVRAFGLENENTENFEDVSASDYFAAELAIARNTGIVKGIGDNKFSPRGSITRQDMMVMLYRAMQKLGIELSGTQTQDVSDMDTVSDYAKEAVEILMANGIITGKNGKIDPLANATRAEVAVMLNRVLELVK